MHGMRIGAALFLFAVGAILKWAITAHVHGINLHVVGVILMFVGIVGLALELYWWKTGRRSPYITRTPNPTYIDERDLVDRPSYFDDSDLADRP
jgi:hypothetical protein